MLNIRLSVESSSSRRLRMRSRERSRVNSSPRWNGLLRKSSAPASRPRTLLSTSERAVSSTTGMKQVGRTLFSRRQTSKPSSRGIMMSSSTACGGARRTAASADSPSLAQSKSYPSSPRIARQELEVLGLVVDRQNAGARLAARRGRDHPRPAASADSTVATNVAVSIGFEM